MALFQKNNNWYIDYYVNGRRKRESIGPNKKLSRTILQKRKVEIAENKFLVVKKNEKILFKDMAKVYLEAYSRPNKKSARRDESCIGNLNRFFGARYLMEITPLGVEEYKLERKTLVMLP